MLTSAPQLTASAFDLNNEEREYLSSESLVENFECFLVRQLQFHCCGLRLR